MESIQTVHSSDSLAGDVVRVLCSLVVPPLGVFLEVGLSKQFWVNVLLTLLGFFPGLIHAVWIIAKR